MAVRKINISLNEYYHVYSRGVDKRPIFLENADRERFIKLMYLCNGSLPVIYKTVKNITLDKIETGEKLIAIGAYILMSNHFHILIKEITEGGTVKFMSKLLTAYSSYFNKKYVRTGALFGSEFKATYLDTDEYLKYIFAYIHLNPLKLFDKDWKEKKIDDKKAKEFLKNYIFSSYIDYLNIEKRENNLILNKGVFPEYFIKEGDFDKYNSDWINFSFV